VENDVDEVLLVTGGSRGIGAATAVLAARKGFAVAVNYTRSEAAAQDVVRTSARPAARAEAVQGDVADEAQVLAMFAQVDSKLGTLTALVNNAGIVDRAARVDEMDLQRLKRMFDINVIGSILCAREAGPAHELAPRGTRRRDRQCLERRGAARGARSVCGLRRVQGGDRCLHHRPGQGSRRRGHPCQRRAARG
jgi:NAD(P)-dependent dehydrogenase (short-subunit alcohol dehydrogenase family)